MRKYLIALLPLMASLTAKASVSSVDAGGSFTISVTADGTTPFAYQWLKDSVLIPGATASTLTKSAVTAVDAGNYSVRVSNSAGFVFSDAASITIIVKPPTKAVTAITSASAPASP